MSSPKVKVVGVVFQNNQGEQYYSKYYIPAIGNYDLTSKEGQKKLQRGLLDKVARMNVIAKLKPQDNEIFSFADLTVLVKVINELMIFLLCDEEENYFVMETLINTLGKVLQHASKDQWSGKAIYDHLDTIILATDELIDEGLIVTLDAGLVIDRMDMRESTGDSSKKTELKPNQPAQGGKSVGGAFSSIFGFAKNSLQKTLNLG